MIKLKPLIICLLIPLAIGGISGFITMHNTELYKSLVLPPFSPPMILFPIVWTLLYILMGISSYLVYMSSSPLKKPSLILYCVQLLVNFIWPILFFNFEAYFLSFIVLLILFVLVAIMSIIFYKIKPLAGILQIPYLIWLLFAGYLNLFIVILNKM